MREALRSIQSGALPDIADVETTSALRRQWLHGSLSTEDFRRALDRLAELPFQRHPAAPYLMRVFTLRDNLTPYDAVYVALAEALDSPLMTADAKLANAPGIRCEVHLVG